MPRDDWGKLARKERGQKALRSGEYDKVSRQKPKKKRKKKKRASQRMPFGKHKGMLYAEIPLGYLNWVIRNVTNNNAVVDACQKEVKRRSKTKHTGQTENTHYQWRNARTGEVYWISNDITIGPNEVCPFDPDEDSVPLVEDELTQLEKEYRAIVR